MVRWFGDAQDGVLAEAHLVDVLRLHLDFGLQCVGFRNDEHEHLARRDHASHRVHRLLKDYAIDRRADIHALELILRRNFFSTSSAVLARISARSLPTSERIS